MGKYNWTMDRIFEKYNYLWQLYKRDYTIKGDDRERLVDDLKFLKLILEEEQENEDKNLKLIERYYGVTDVLEDMDYLWEEVKDFDLITKERYDLPEIKRCSLSKEDLLSLTHDFF